jgi:hypothetical protein
MNLTTVFEVDPQESLDNYFSDLEQLTAICKVRNIASHEVVQMLIDENNVIVARMIAARRVLLTPPERDSAMPYLAIGIFRNQTTDNRLVLFLICFEVEERLYTERMELRLEPYNQAQRIFIEEPSLWADVRQSRKGKADLVSAANLKQVDGTEFVRVGRHYAEIDYALNPGMLTWVKEAFPSCPTYVRLHPDKIFTALPKSRLSEEIVRQIDPNWWKRLSVYPGNWTGSAQVLQPPERVQDDFEKWWEFHVKGIRKLEMSVERDYKGNLSIMLEELVQPPGRAKQLVGRCVHLDTDAKFGTDVSKARLNHIDLAFNWYPGDAADERLRQRLDKGKVTDAKRTHLLRLEGIPFLGFFAIASCFVQSRVLIREWLSVQSQPIPETHQ